ncbi:MAG: hypothetical protein FWH44_00120 [Methanomassiliicoccaceae archaeon]|nr:hypothetical protein [Methanomassiliicoccaceae archaeon]
MIRSRKAMAAVIDAFIFITVIGIVAGGMFVYLNASHESETKAKTYYDAFFAIELRTNDVFEGSDTQCIMMCDLIAAHMASDQGTVKAYAANVLEKMIPPMYCYLFVFEYDGRVMTIGKEGGKLDSRYSSEMTIISGKSMRATLSIY